MLDTATSPQNGEFVIAGAGEDSKPVWSQLTVLVGTALLVLIQLYVAIPLAPLVAEEIGGGPASAALGTAYSLAYAIGFLIWGPLSDRFGRKTILVPGMAVLALVTALLATATTIPALALLRAMQGLVASCFPVAALAYLGEALPLRWRSIGIGAVSTAFLVAGILGQVYAQAVAATIGWRWVFLLAAPALGVASLAMAAALVGSDRSGPPSSLRQKYSELLAFARRREFVFVYLAGLTVLGSFVAMYATLGPLLREQFALDGNGVLLVRLVGLPAMLIAPVAGELVGRHGAERVTISGFLLAATGLASEALASRSLPLLVIGSVIFVAGIAVIVPAIIALVAGRGGVARGGAIGLLGLTLFAGASIGALAPEFDVGFSTLLLLMAALLVGGAVLVGRSRGREAR